MTNVVDGYEIRVRQSGAREARKAIEDIGTAAQGAGKKVGAAKAEIEDFSSEAEGVRRGASAFSEVGRGAEGAAGGIRGAVQAATALAAAYGALTAGRFFVQQSDAYNRIQSQLALITDSEAERSELSRKVLQIAQDTGQEFEAQAKLVGRISLAAGELGVTQDEILAASKLISQTFLISGTSAAEAASSATQFAQALASGTLQGDELRSILENNAALARAIADGLGVSVGQLRAMGANGELVAKDILPAILSQSQKINEQFAKALPLISQGATRLENSAINFVGKLDEAIGLSQRLGDVLKEASSALDSSSAFVERNSTQLGGIAAAVAAIGREFGRGTPLGRLLEILEAGSPRLSAGNSGAAANILGGRGLAQSLAGKAPARADYSREELAALAGFADPPAAVAATAARATAGAGGQRRASGDSAEARFLESVAQGIKEAREEATQFFESTLTPAEELARQIERVTALKDFFGSQEEFERTLASMNEQARELRLEADGTADAMQRVRDLIESAVSPAERLKRQFDEIRRLRALGSENGGLGNDEAQKAFDAVRDQLDALNGQGRDSLLDLDSVAARVGENMQDIFANAIEDGFEEGADGALEIVGRLFRQIAAQAIAQQGARLFQDFLVGALGAVAGGGGGLSKAGATGPSGGPKAMGGPVQEGRTYLVGETGPELFTAPANGRITPSGETAEAGGKGVTIVNVKDPREALMAMQTSEGGSVLRNIVSTNREEFRRILGVV